MTETELKQAIMDAYNQGYRDAEPKLKNRQIGAAGFVANKIMENAISKFKQETLEEAAEKETEVQGWGEYESNSEQYAIKQAFINGAKWQQERMFKLVEEYNQMLVDPNVHEDHKEKAFKEWFKQFKNK
jgi:uncharacterized protein YbaA (DUF1428 family)